jgi:hypothetical protein
MWYWIIGGICCTVMVIIYCALITGGRADDRMEEMYERQQYLDGLES